MDLWRPLPLRDGVVDCRTQRLRASQRRRVRAGPQAPRPADRRRADRRTSPGAPALWCAPRRSHGQVRPCCRATPRGRARAARRAPLSSTRSRPMPRPGAFSPAWGRLRTTATVSRRVARQRRRLRRSRSRSRSDVLTFARAEAVARVVGRILMPWTIAARCRAPRATKRSSMTDSPARQRVATGARGSRRPSGASCRSSPSTGVDDATVLEVGGGVGEIQLELLARGAARTVNLELSGAYEAEAARLIDEAGVDRARHSSTRRRSRRDARRRSTSPISSCCTESSAATPTTSSCWEPPPIELDARSSSVIHPERSRDEQRSPSRTSRSGSRTRPTEDSSTRRAR